MSLDDKLRGFATAVDSPGEILRRKLLAFVKAVNHGNTRVSVYGFGVDILSVLESELRKHDDAELLRMLEILRE